MDIHMHMRSSGCRTVIAAACATLLGSCATVAPFTPDLAATAPRLEGYGHSEIAITTRSERARQLFNEGVLQAYAFNETEAVRMFKAALAQDPSCAMCAWGVAWQLGPNINDPSRDHAAEALKYVDHGLKHATAATPRERALLAALAVRYAHPSAARETAPLLGPTCGSKPESDADPVDPLDTAYAEKMRALADAFPSDPDIASLYAEAEMIATEGDRPWTKDGKPVGRIGEVLARVERLASASPEHTGLTHYLVHLADAPAPAARAVAAADRLARLAPKAPHLVHMPSHIYVHVGRYSEAAQNNVAAVAADTAFAETEKAQGFTVSKDWRGHNRHFLWYAAVMDAREDLALATADDLAGMVSGAKTGFAEYIRSMRLLTLVRMEQWERVLAEPAPLGDRGVAQAWFEYARGTAHARLGRVDEAAAALTRLQVAAGAVRSTFAGKSQPQKTMRALADVAETSLQAQLALARRDFAEAIAQQQKAMQGAEKLDEREPPMLADGTRLVLGDMQIAAGRGADAEATFRTALAEHPRSGWALRGLARALQAQGMPADAVRAELDRAWPNAPARLRRI